MRQFTSKEKEMINKIINLKNNSGLGELQFAKLIRENLNSVAITWEIGEKASISIYTTNKETLNEYYFNISDFLYLVDELANNNLIALDRYTDTPEKPKRILYDHTKYAHTIEGVDISYEGDYIMLYAISNTNEQKKFILLETSIPKYNVQLANLFEKYANTIIYPLPLLIDIAENEFKDVEQRRFDEQLNQERRHHKESMLDAIKKHKEQMCVARWSFVIALFAGIIPSLISIYIFNNTPATKVDSDQLGAIEEAIKSTKREFPNQIDVSLPDTITIKDINQKPIINNIYNNVPQNETSK